MPGALYLIATPIGNLEDITLRALRILREEADRIACEDTRHSGKLLAHYNISKPLVSYHEHNERTRGEELAAAMAAGERIALISDAGTPLISDPGYRLVERAIAAGVPVIPVPGACAAVAAVAAGGLPSDTWIFAGFLPPKCGQRRKALELWAAAPATLIFYEAPHRIAETLRDVDAVLGARPVVVCRELTKLHEEFLRGTPAELAAGFATKPPRGEMTLLIGRGEGIPVQALPLEQAVEQAMEQGRTRMEAIKQVAKERGLAKRDVYQALESKRAGG